MTRGYDPLNGADDFDLYYVGRDCSTGGASTGGFAGGLLALLARMVRRRKGVAIAAALAATSTAVAQDDIPDSGLIFVPDLQSQLYRPSIDAESTLWTDDSGGRTDSMFTFGRVAANYINHPFVIRYGDGQTIDLVEDALQLDVIAGMQYDRFRLGVDLPIYVFTRSDLADEGPGLGDIALDGRMGLVDRDASGFGVALGGRLSLPTASIASPLGTAAGKPGWEAQLILDKDIGPVLIAANLGYRGIPEQEMINVIWDDQLMWRVGAGWQLNDTMILSADFAGAQVVRMIGKDNVSRPSRGAGTPMELLGGTKIRLAETIQLDLGVGTGIGSGIGAPSLRVLAGIGYRPAKTARTDGDSIGTLTQTAPEIPDVPGVEPEDVTVIPVDTSALDIPDVPDIPEIADVPVIDVPVVEVPVVEVPEDVVPTDVTVPGTDVTIPVAELPEAPEAIPTGDIRVEVVDEDGSPIVGAYILADDEQIGRTGDDGLYAATTPVGPTTFAAHADGYRHVQEDIDVIEGEVITLVLTAEPATAELVGDRIDLRDSVYFATNQAEILPVSATLLQDVIGILNDHPELTQIRIEGHTDSRGSAAYNLDLSGRRAASVRQYLVDRGIADSRLVSEGFGENQPLDDRQVPEAWTKNRRVDFFVVERSD